MRCWVIPGKSCRIINLLGSLQTRVENKGVLGFDHYLFRRFRISSSTSRGERKSCSNSRHCKRCSQVISQSAVCRTSATGAVMRTFQNRSIALDPLPLPSAFRLERRLPASVRGPVDLRALRRLAAKRAAVTVRLRRMDMAEIRRVTMLAHDYRFVNINGLPAAAPNGV